MLNETLSLTLQIAILSSGIYLFLRFLRTTRGSGLLRGLFVAFLFGVIGLWGLSKYLKFLELNHIIEGFTPYLAVILTIIFQPELRRAMARLGQQNRLAQLFSSGQKETVTRVANAAIAMAARRHGALIAFQQDTPLVAWTANAAHIDAEVSATLLESIFHPGASLHDGGVVIEGDRVVAAACLFPLTENIELSKSTGTRHRAALGLTEESDAVTLIVSEETGQISIARQGFMSRDIPPADLEQGLRDAMGLLSKDESQANRRGRIPRALEALMDFLTEDLLRKASSLILGCGMIYVAHQDIVTTSLHTLQVVEVAPGTQVRPRPGLLQIRLPEGSYHLFSPSSDSDIEVLVSGTQTQIDGLRGILGGVLTVPLNAPEGASDISISDITWISGSDPLDLIWSGGRPPRLEIQRYSRHSVELLPRHLKVDISALDPHFTAQLEAIKFAPGTIEIEGPGEAIRAVKGGGLPFELESIVVRATDREDITVSIGLSEALLSSKISMLGGDQVLATLPIEPAQIPIPSIEREIVIVNMRPVISGMDPQKFVVEQSNQIATFSVTSVGLFDSVAGSAAFDQTMALIRGFVAENLKAYVDISDAKEGGDVVPVRWDFPPDWLKVLFPGREQEFADSARLDIRLESISEVLLTPK